MSSVTPKKGHASSDHPTSIPRTRTFPLASDGATMSNARLCRIGRCKHQAALTAVSINLVSISVRISIEFRNPARQETCSRNAPASVCPAAAKANHNLPSRRRLGLTYRLNTNRSGVTNVGSGGTGFVSTDRGRMGRRPRYQRCSIGMRRCTSRGRFWLDAKRKAGSGSGGRNRQVLSHRPLQFRIAAPLPG